MTASVGHFIIRYTTYINFELKLGLSVAVSILCECH